MSYPTDLLSTRAVVKPGLFAVIPKDGLVSNVLPFLEGCRTSIVASPKMGAGFAAYLCRVQPGGGTSAPFGAGEGEESFLYVLSGAVEAAAGGERLPLEREGYLYAPPDRGITFTNTGGEEAELLLYKQRYIPCAQAPLPTPFAGSTRDIPFRDYEGMSNVHIKDLLPTELSFDMNMHVLSFDPGGCHPIVETHVQEHGAYILSGEGMYLMDNTWMGIKAGDFMWFGPYVPQCAYGVGREPFAYLYSKDCNRDVSL